MTQFHPAYLLFGNLNNDPPLQENYYPPIDEAHKIANECTIECHEKSKKRYDQHFIEAKFEFGKFVIYEEFQNVNAHKLSQPFLGSYTILKKMSLMRQIKLITIRNKIQK